VGKPSLNAAQLYAKAEGRVFLLVPAYPGCPGTKVVKQLLLLLLLLLLYMDNVNLCLRYVVAHPNDLEVTKHGTEFVSKQQTSAAASQTQCRHSAVKY